MSDSYIQANSLDDLLKISPTKEIQTAFASHYRRIHGYDDFLQFKNIVVSISGGADSDRMLDMIERIGYQEGTLQYVFFDTGMEYEATKQHLFDLEQKYGIKINREKAKMPVALAVKKYGFPFLSKQVSENIQRLQKHNFCWTDEPVEVLYERYPRCKSALRWWCNKWESKRSNISWNPYLKEFLIENPPKIPISQKCCLKAKKEVFSNFVKNSETDLCVQGLRKAEGGSRAKITNCFEQHFDGISVLRPLFWFKKKDCCEYDKKFNVIHSDCYLRYGLDRTGCACCPFGKCFEKELEAARKFEPQLYRLAIAVFGESYEYTRKYREFVKQRQPKGGSGNG